MPPRVITRLPALKKHTIFMTTFLCACILLQPNLADAGGTATIGGVFCGTINLGSEDSGYRLSVTPDISGWTLTPSDIPYTKTGSLNIDVPNSEDSWIVKVTAEAGSEGRLREYDPTLATPGYVGTGKFTEPLHIIAPSEGSVQGHEVDLSKASTGQTLISGTGDATIALTISQKVTWTDVPLQSDHVYRTVVNFSFG